MLLENDYVTRVTPTLRASIQWQNMWNTVVKQNIADWLSQQKFDNYIDMVTLPTHYCLQMKGIPVQKTATSSCEGTGHL